MSKKLRLAFKGCRPDMATVKRYAPDGNYTQYSSGYSCRIDTGTHVLSWSEEPCGVGMLALISQARSLAGKAVREGKVQPVKWRPKFATRGKLLRACDAVELDVSAAYLSAARKLGVLPEYFCKRLEQCHKRTRLKVVGALGSRVSVTEFKNWKPVETKSKFDPDTCKAWEWIVADLDRSMHEMAEACGGDFLFYWTDAIFAQNSRDGSVATRNRIVAKARELGYEVKAKLVKVERIDKRAVFMGDGRRFAV